MRFKLDPRAQAIAVSIFSLLSSFCVLVLGCVLVKESRTVSESIGYKVYQVYGGGLLEGIKNLLPRVLDIEEVIKELDIVIHDVLINDIADTVDLTVVITGAAIIGLASLQIVANSLLLRGTWTRNKKLVPSSLITRIFFFSTFWGIIDSFRHSLGGGDMAVLLV